MNRGRKSGKSDPARHFKAMLPDEAEARLASLGEEPYRGRQILEWIYEHGAGEFEAMTPLPMGLRKRLAGAFPLDVLDVKKETRAPDGTVKVLFRTPDGFFIESVLIPKGRFRTACLSTQAGCPLACVFCATGLSGFHRNLRPEEIVDQALSLLRLSGEGRPLTHIVLMGMGEPLLNCDAVFRAVRVLTHPRAGGLSPGRVTLSTAGIVEGLERLRLEDLKINVALSLNATTEDRRLRLMPGTRKNPLHEVIEAFRAVPATRRNLRTLEYVLLSEVNDSREDGAGLARLAGRVGAGVNLIPFNEVKGIPFRAPPEERVEAFLGVLVRSGVTATVRRSRGAGIGAACGQLAGREGT